MKTADKLRPRPTPRRRPSPFRNNHVRTFPRSKDLPREVAAEAKQDDTFWIGYRRFLVFVIVVATVGKIAVWL